jgi:transposase
MLFKPMMLAHSALVTQVEFCDVQILKFAKGDETTRRLMTAPGVGPATALALRSAIDDPNRFVSSNDVDAYLRLAPRRYQSGELDRTGRISKRGDRVTRVLPARPRASMLSVVNLLGVCGWPNVSASRRPRPLSPTSSLSFCIWVGGTKFQWGKEKAIETSSH